MHKQIKNSVASCRISKQFPRHSCGSRNPDHYNKLDSHLRRNNRKKLCDELQGISKLTPIMLTITFLLFWTAPSMATWQIDIEVSTPDSAADIGIALNRLSIGTEPSASDGYDNHLDTIALLDGPIQAFSFHPEYQSNQQRLWRDFRKESLPQEWQFEISSSKKINPIKISWNIDAPDNVIFTLTDKESSQEIIMTSSSEHSYNNNTTAPKTFLMKASESLQGSGGESSTVGSKGGGCGYIKNAGQRDKGYGQMALNTLILMIPLLIPLRHYARHHVLVRTRG